MLKDCYLSEVDRIIAKQKEYKDSFCFAVVADSHLDDSVADTAQNIKAVHDAVGFSCLIHLGDFLNGNLSRFYTKKLLKEQMELFKNSVSGKPFYPVQGNHDGFENLISGYSNIAKNEEWYNATSFADDYPGVVRSGKKPYFFVDFPERKLRLIILCTFFYTSDGDTYEKFYGTDTEQIAWVENTALNIDSSWTVLFFSHDTPFKRFDAYCCENNPRINGNLLMHTVKLAQRNRGFQIPAWFAGHFHGDYIGKVNGLNFILVASETAYVPWLWGMPEGGYFPERSVGTNTEDLWDCVSLDQKARKIRLMRFGAGKDRELNY